MRSELIMTKKTLQLLATIAAVTGLGLASTVTANAAISGTQSTTANVTLNAGSGSGDGSDGNTDGNAGGIKLTNVPGFDFGEQTIDASRASATYDAGSNIQPVTVVNPGIATGWNVTVSLAPMKSGDDVLRGSNLVLTGTDSGATTTNSDATGAPTFGSATLAADGSTGAKSVAVATEKAGLGTWNMTYSSAQLEVAQNNLAGVYSGDLTWTLTNAPANS